jgi:hypothetical protein
MPVSGRLHRQPPACAAGVTIPIVAMTANAMHGDAGAVL